MPRERVFDLGMSGDRLLLSGGRIQIDVMLGAVAMEDASGAYKLSDELAPLHKTISFIW